MLGPKNTNEAAMVPSADWPVGHTANLCTPQSFVSWKGTADYKAHCTASQYPEAWKKTNIPWDREWSDVAVRMLGDSLATHYIRGQAVFEYSKLRLDDGTSLKEGYIATQAEGTEGMFKSIEVLDLVGCMDAKSPAYRKYFMKSDPAGCRGASLAETAPAVDLVRIEPMGNRKFRIHGAVGAEVLDMRGIRIKRIGGNGSVFVSGPGLYIIRSAGPAGAFARKLPIY